MRNGLTPELVEKYFVELWDEICVAAAVNRICLSATESATERGKSSPSTSLLVKRLRGIRSMKIRAKDHRR